MAHLQQLAHNASAAAGSMLQGAAGALQAQLAAMQAQLGAVHGNMERSRERGAKFAKFLLSADEAASLDMPTFAFDGVNGTTRFNVTVAMLTAGGEDSNMTRILMRFPHFPHMLFYDPSLSTESSTSAGYNVSSVENVDAALAATSNPAQNTAQGTAGAPHKLLLALAAAVLLTLTL
jgi:hypothetical protein